MTTLIEVLALQRAQSYGREDIVKSDIIWAQANIDEFESQCECLGLQGLDNDILFDTQLSHLR